MLYLWGMENIPRGIRIAFLILFWFIVGIGGSIGLTLLLNLNQQGSLIAGIILGAASALGGIELFRIFD